jgi:hypothetical protein
MSFPISASQLRLLKKQEDERKCEDIIVAVIESISESVVYEAKLVNDTYHVHHHTPVYELTQYQLDKIMAGLRSNFPDCFVKYSVGQRVYTNGSTYTEYRFMVDWSDKTQKSFAS